MELTSVQVRALHSCCYGRPALRILPFKVRPHSVSPYPHAGLDPCVSWGGSLGAPKAPFISCHQPVMRSHLQEISKHVLFS